MTGMILEEILRFLPWCWAVNMSFDVLLYTSRRNQWIAAHNTPVDGGVMLPDGHRLLGDSTTWLGLLQAGVLGVLGQVLFPGYSLFTLAILVWCGHALGSFVKRRLGIERGGFLPLIDHGDYVLIAGGTFYVFGMLTLPAFLISWLLTLAVTPLVTYLAHLSGIRGRPL